MRGVGALAFVLVTVTVRAATPHYIGKEIALHGMTGVAACASCHGARGLGRAHFSYPKLAGLNGHYLRHSLEAFRDGRRLNGIMTPIARALPLRARRAVAAYYASLPPMVQKPHPYLNMRRWVAGRALYAHGDLVDHVLGCARCHGSQGQGFGSHFPRLAGQSLSYLTHALAAFQVGNRNSQDARLMQGAARPLSSRQIEEVALYLNAVGNVTKPTVPSSIGMVPIDDTVDFLPPHRAAVPKTALGRVIIEGRAIFDHTPRYAHRFVHTDLSCADCHLGEGRAAYAAPMWAAAALYPRFYQGHLMTLTQRLQMAFLHNEGGLAPALDSKTLVDLSAYVHWMSRGILIGAHMPGRGYRLLGRPPHPVSIARGAALYSSQCAVCHGAQGQGLWHAGHLVFPPVWGVSGYSRHSSLDIEPITAAFLRATMPYGNPESLSIQEAYDLAAFLRAHPHPP